MDVSHSSLTAAPGRDSSSQLNVYRGQMRLLKVPQCVAIGWHDAPPSKVVGYLEKNYSNEKEQVVVEDSQLGEWAKTAAEKGGGSSCGGAPLQSKQELCSNRDILHTSFDVRQFQKPTDSLFVLVKCQHPDGILSSPPGHPYYDMHGPGGYSGLAAASPPSSLTSSTSSASSVSVDGESVAIHASVTDCSSVMPKFDDHYRRRWQQRFQGSVIKQQQTAMATATASKLSGGANSESHLFRYYSQSSAQSNAAQRGSVRSAADAGLPKMRAKRARIVPTMTQEDLQKVVFKLMEEGPPEGLSMNDVFRKTGQPQGIVKDVVERICDLRKHRYTLKQHLAPQRFISASSGRSDTGDNAPGAAEAFG